MVVSVHPGRKRIIALGVALAVLTAVLLFMPRGEAQAEGEVNRAGGTADERISFLAQYGWEVDPEPMEIREVLIPEKFDEVYTRYNELQKQQDMDLKPYAGKTCRQWIYKVLNYPGTSEEVRAVMLVYEGEVIAGDISSVAIDGFMVPFRGPEPEKIASEENEEQAEKETAVQGEIPEDAWPVD